MSLSGAIGGGSMAVVNSRRESMKKNSILFVLSYCYVSLQYETIYYGQFDIQVEYGLMDFYLSTLFAVPFFVLFVLGKMNCRKV